MDLSGEIERILFSSIKDDIGEAGDVTSNAVIAADAVDHFVLRTREEIVFCGVDVIKKGFGEYAEIFVHDGEVLKPEMIIAKTSCRTIETLALERSVLNLIQFLSGIATETARYVKAIEGTKAKIYDTRKTIPGLRILSKYAVKCGGGENHRMGLYDMVMIKDNHIRAAGEIATAVVKARSTGLKIEVECDSLEQVTEALKSGADIIMADNMDLGQLREAVRIIGSKVPLEASGNVSLQTVRQIAETGVDFISTSKITMSARAVDIGLDRVNY